MDSINVDLPLMWIEWEDSIRCGVNWQTIRSHEAESMPCVSVGFLLKETEDTITICGNLDTTPLVREGESGRIPRSFIHGMDIPKRSIVRQWEIKF